MYCCIDDPAAAAADQVNLELLAAMDIFQRMLLAVEQQPQPQLLFQPPQSQLFSRQGLLRFQPHHHHHPQFRLLYLRNLTSMFQMRPPMPDTAWWWSSKDQDQEHLPQRWQHHQQQQPRIPAKRKMGEARSCPTKVQRLGGLKQCHHLDHGATTSSSSSPPSSSSSSLVASKSGSGDTSRMLYDQKGRVTFRPYTDSLYEIGPQGKALIIKTGGPSSSMSYHRRRYFLSGRGVVRLCHHHRKSHDDYDEDDDEEDYEDDDDEDNDVDDDEDYRDDDGQHALFSSGGHDPRQQHRHIIRHQRLPKGAKSRGNRETRLKGEAAVSEAHNVTTIGSLFPEILSIIFEHLDIASKGRAAQVSRGWRDAAYKKSCWKGVEAKLHLNRANPVLYPSLIRRGIKRVQVLSLRKSLRELTNGLPEMESLNLSGCYNLSDAIMEQAFQAHREYPALRELNLSLCKEISDTTLARITSTAKNLRALDLGGCNKVTNGGLLMVAWNLRKLAKLNLRSCRQVTDHGIGHLSGAHWAIAAAASAAAEPASSSLKSSTGAGQAGLAVADNDGLHSLPSQPMVVEPPPLEELCLQDCLKLTDESLNYLAASGFRKTLKRLNLSFCVSITDTGLKSVSRLASMEHLNLRSCDNVSDIGIAFLAEPATSGAGSSSTISTQMAAPVGSYQGSSTSPGHAGPANRLQSLDVSFCSNVTNSGLKHVAAGLQGLKCLSMTTCAINDEGVQRMAEHLFRLENLNIGQCVGVTDEGLKSIASKVKTLKSIDLYGCPRVTDDGVKNLRKQIPCLSNVKLAL